MASGRFSGQEGQHGLIVPLELVLGFGIGASLGLLGGGGSMLTVPALVYLIGQTPQAAVTTSLAIVGMNSLIGAMFHRAQGTLDWKVALLFGGAGMLASYFSANVTRHLSSTMLLVAFAILMLIVGIMFFFHRADESGITHSVRSLPLTLRRAARVWVFSLVLWGSAGDS